MKQTEAPERQGRMTPEGLARSYERNVDTVWNVCITFLKNPADAEDAVQETFLRLLRSAPELGSETHGAERLQERAGARKAARGAAGGSSGTLCAGAE